MVQKEDVYDALREVYDPEIRVNIVDLGLIYDVEIAKNEINIKMTLTSPNCPASPEIKKDVVRAGMGLDEVKEVSIELIWDPPWDTSRMSEEAKLELGYDIF